MNVLNSSGYESMSQTGAGIIRDLLEETPNALICVAGGSSPRRMYEILAGDPIVTGSQVRTIVLDEWRGLEPEHPSSSYYQLKREVFDPWEIPESRWFAWKSSARDPKAECHRMAAILEREGPIDLCILGLGKNGHLGLNEPGDVLLPHAHEATLTESSQSHSMLTKEGVRLTQGLTFGMADILSSRKILMLATGEDKESVAKQFLIPKISTHLPASFLHLHPDVHVLHNL